MLPTNLTSLERRYKFQSSEAGTIASAYDVSVCIFILFVSYWGGHGHKPRILSICYLVVSFGAFVFITPHIFGSSYETSSSTTLYETCGSASSSPSENCGAAASGNARANAVAWWVFLVGQGLIGLGASALYILGPNYLNDNTVPSITPIYLGLFYATSAIGPALGFVVGGSFLSMWVDTGAVAPLGMSPTDPKWVGRWWLGYLLCAVFGLSTFWLLSLFPKKFSRAQIKNEMTERVSDGAEDRLSRMDRAFADCQGNSKTDLDHPDPRSSGVVDAESAPMERTAAVKDDRPPSVVGLESMNGTLMDLVKNILTNVPFMFNAGAVTCDAFLAKPFSVFIPKIVQSLYGLTSSQAALYVGLTVVPGAAGGMILGGFILSKFNITGRRMALYNMCCSFLALLGVLMFFISCPDSDFVGISSPYPGTSAVTRNVDLTPNFFPPGACNTQCFCNPYESQPVCGSDGKEYFDACAAGCTTKTYALGAAARTYSGCTCMTDASQTAIVGACRTSCTTLPLFLSLFFLVMIISFAVNVSNVKLTMTVLTPSERPVGMALQSLFYRLLGAFPGPMVFGALIDSACEWWTNDCGVKGSCKRYNNAQVTSAMIKFAIVVKAMGTVSYALVYMYFDHSSETTTLAMKEQREALASDEQQVEVELPTRRGIDAAR